MLTKEAIADIKILPRHGLSVRSIAKELDVSRNTVRKYLRGEAVKAPGQRGPGNPRNLVLYEDWLIRRTETAKPFWVPVTVLQREVRAMGIDGI